MVLLAYRDLQAINIKLKDLKARKEIKKGKKKEFMCKVFEHGPSCLIYYFKNHYGLPGLLQRFLTFLI